MSSFIVSNNCIDKIISRMGYEDIDRIGAKDADNAGRNLLELNIRATKQRYSEPYLSSQQEKERINGYFFHDSLCSRVVSLKALQCFLYQCAEGDIPNSKIYKELRMLEYSWLRKIVDALPEYDKAPWGD